LEGQYIKNKSIISKGTSLTKIPASLSFLPGYCAKEQIKMYRLFLNKALTLQAILKLFPIYLLEDYYEKLLFKPGDFICTNRM
jgi:hypothetical protein